MLDNIDKKALTNDLVKWATIFVVAHIIVKYLTNATMFDEASVREILATLAGVAIYHAVVVQVVKPQ
jgi:hypothetical protein